MAKPAETSLEATAHPGIWKRTVVRFDERGEPRGAPKVTYKARCYGADGKEHAKYFPTLTAAKNWRTNQLADRTKGQWFDPSAGRITLAEYAHHWLRTRVDLRKSTRRIYEGNLRLHILAKVGDIELGPMALGAITTEALRHWIAELSANEERNLSPTTVNQVYRTLNAMLRAAVEDERLAKNPLGPIKPPKPLRVPMRFLTQAEVEDLADTINPSYRAFVLVGAYCGLRLGELAGLRWSDVDMLQRRITVENQLGTDEQQLAPLKTTASYRTIVMPRFVADVLGVHARFGATPSPSERGAFVFASPGGTPLQIHNFRHRVWQPAVRKAGFTGLRVHDLRHTCASLAIAAGADVKVLQDMLGHASAAMTLDQYGKLMPGRSEQVADRLDALHRGTA